MSNIKYNPVCIGNIYGRLKVIAFDRTEIKKSGQKIHYWLCECNCINKTIKSIRGDSLKQGKTKSCGCIQKEIASNNYTQNLIGKKFNKLTVISRANNKGKSAAWNCICECGKKTIVTSNSLTTNRTKSCGCINKKRIKEIGKLNFKDLTGQKFGRLTVIKQVDKPSNLKSSSKFWLCNCECGNKIIVNSSLLMSGNTKSCGCLQKELASERSLIDLTGMKFGKLTVIKRDIDHILPNGKHATMWRCLCDCGNECTVYGCSLYSKNTQSCGCINSVGEQLIFKYLTNKNINFTKQYSDLNCKSIKTLRFDFSVFIHNKLSFLIEYDGEQHFYPVRFNGMTVEKSLVAFEENKLRDEIKNEYCTNNNILLLRIPYWEMKNIGAILDIYINNYNQQESKKQDSLLLCSNE